MFFFYSCGESEQKDVIYQDRYREYLTNNFDSYNKIYNAINDTINVWVEDSLGRSLSLIGNHWQLDSAIVFNQDSSRLYTTVNIIAAGWKHSKLDYIYEFGGAYLEDDWFYYYIPVSMPVSRLKYKDSLYEPYTFDELSYIAHKRRFGGMLNRAEDGSIGLNEKSFNRKFFDLKSGRSYQQEKIYRDNRLIKKKHHKNARGKLKPGRIEEIKAEMAASIRPPEPVEEVKERSWWDIMFGEPEQPKLFESDAWKNRRKRKSEN